MLRLHSCIEIMKQISLLSQHLTLVSYAGLITPVRQLTYVILITQQRKCQIKTKSTTRELLPESDLSVLHKIYFQIKGLIRQRRINYHKAAFSLWSWHSASIKHNTQKQAHLEAHRCLNQLQCSSPGNAEYNLNCLCAFEIGPFPVACKIIFLYGPFPFSPLF